MRLMRAVHQGEMTTDELWEEIERWLNVLEVVGGRLLERDTVEVWHIEFQVRNHLAYIDQLLFEIEARKSTKNGEEVTQ